MPGADRPLPPPEPFQGEMQPLDPQQQQHQKPLQAPLNTPVGEKHLQQQRLPLGDEGDEGDEEKEVRQVLPTTVLQTDITSKSSAATTTPTVLRSEAILTESDKVDEHKPIPDVPPAASERNFVAAADVTVMDTGNSGDHNSSATDSKKEISYLLDRFSMLHREGRLEEAAATLEQALGIMEGKRRWRRYDARAADATAAAVNQNIPENKFSPAGSSIAGGERSPPYRGVKDAEGANRGGKDGVARENSSDSVGQGLGPDRKFLREDEHLESSVAVAEASAIAGVMNDLGCTLQQVFCGICSFACLYTVFLKRAV